MSTAEHDSQEASVVATFVTALGKLGWVAGQNLEIAVRWGAGDADRMTANARELVGLAPDVLLVKGANLPAARQATTSRPSPSRPVDPADRGAAEPAPTVVPGRRAASASSA